MGILARYDGSSACEWTLNTTDWNNHHWCFCELLCNWCLPVLDPMDYPVSRILTFLYTPLNIRCMRQLSLGNHRLITGVCKGGKAPWSPWSPRTYVMTWLHDWPEVDVLEGCASIHTGTLQLRQLGTGSEDKLHWWPGDSGVTLWVHPGFSAHLAWWLKLFCSLRWGQACRTFLAVAGLMGFDGLTIGNLRQAD